MQEETGPAAAIRTLVRWAIKPPQVYVTYVIGLLLIWGVSFYAGTLNPKHSPGSAPPPVSAPRN